MAQGHPRLKLGKRAAFVKTRLKRLPRQEVVNLGGNYSGPLFVSELRAAIIRLGCNDTSMVVGPATTIKPEPFPPKR